MVSKKRKASAVAVLEKTETHSEDNEDFEFEAVEDEPVIEPYTVMRYFHSLL